MKILKVKTTYSYRHGPRRPWKNIFVRCIGKANVVEGEYGGITQHIGAYQISKENNKITFIDIQDMQLLQK